MQAAYTTWCYSLQLIEKRSKKSPEEKKNPRTLKQLTSDDLFWPSKIYFFFIDLIYYRISLLSYLAVDNLVLNLCTDNNNSQ